MANDTTVLVGTTKGAFILGSDRNRVNWDVKGPLCDGWTINHMIGSPEAGLLWAGGGGEWHGAGVWRSEDAGETWALSKLSCGQFDTWAANDPEIAKMFGWRPVDAPFTGEADAIWSLGYVHGQLYAGTKPAALFRSANGGQSWERLQSLTDHPSHDGWNPGAAGLVLHTIVANPGDARRIWVGISAAGVFATEDGGQTWERRNRLDNAGPCEHNDHPTAPRDGETGHCVHNMMRAPGEERDLLYQQNHHGVYRSRDGGRNWQDITKGLPSTFGFPIAVHPRDSETVWVIPLNGDSQGRFPPDATAAVWKTSDGGESWSAKRNGLPAENCFFTVLRQAMAVDAADPAGVYFGTNSGSVFCSRDEGESWSEIARHLPTILSVETL